MGHKKMIAGMMSLLFCLCFTFSTLAHGGEPRLEINPERVNPGAVVDVRGVEFEPEEAIRLSLVGPGVEIQLAELVADNEGGFIQIITLPVDLAEGSYNFRARTDDHEIFSPALMVQGPAILNEENSEAREEDDTLLAPMPTFPPATAVTAIPVTAKKLPLTVIRTTPTTAIEEAGSSISPGAAAIVLSIVLAGIFLIWKGAQKR